MIKMTSKATVKPGTEESDKGSVRDKRTELTELNDALLETLREVPSVEELARFSNARLCTTHLRWCWIDHERWSELRTEGSRRWTADEQLAATASAAYSSQLLQNLYAAQAPRVPVLPDYRPLGWADVGDTMALYLINCSNKDIYRRLLLANGTITKCVAPVVADDGHIITPAYLIVQITNPEAAGWPMDTCEYDLCSPYIMAPEDVEYFRGHYMHMRTWLEKCGEVYSDFRINDELKQAFTRALHNR